jgi:hypothetical protein
MHHHADVADFERIGCLGSVIGENDRLRQHLIVHVDASAWLWLEADDVAVEHDAADAR